MNDTHGGPSPVEVHLEELGQHSWWRALLNTVTGTSGRAQYRFVARVAGAADTPDLHVREGATFPLMRWQDLGDEHQPNAFSDIAHQRLEGLDASLRDDGWRRCEETGRHWWSRTYEGGQLASCCAHIPLTPAGDRTVGGAAARRQVAREPRRPGPGAKRQAPASIPSPKGETACAPLCSVVPKREDLCHEPAIDR